MRLSSYYRDIAISEIWVFKLVMINTFLFAYKLNKLLYRKRYIDIANAYIIML